MRRSSKAGTPPGRPIRPTIGTGFMRQKYSGKPYLHCMNEVIKNSRDWGASLINIVTTTPDRATIVDNGDGMDADNRDAVFSVNTSTAHGERQSGRFCTGFKYLMYSHGQTVVIRTAPKDEPDLVYVFSIVVDEHEEIILRGGTITPQVLPRDSSSWPYEFRTGTEITVTFRNPRSAAIRRGESLAADLASRLPLKLAGVVTVDGAALPAREIVGERFIETRLSPQLGEIGFDLYHPKDAAPGEELFVTAGEVGEVPMRNLISQLGEYRDRVPRFCLLEQVKGVVSWRGLRDYMNEDRATISSAIADSPHVLKLLRELELIEAQVCHRLRIRLRGAAESEGGPDIQPVLDLMNEIWGGSGSAPGEGPGSHDAAGESGVRRPPSPRSAILTETERFEYELGETVTISARIGAGFRYDVGMIQWHALRSRGRDVLVRPGALQFVADSLGESVVTAEIPGTPHVATVTLRFVAKRRPHLNTHHPEIEVGDEHHLILMNADLLGSEPEWGHSGVGILTPSGSTAVFTSAQAGQATIRVRSADGREQIRPCTVTVVERRDAAPTVRINGYEFRVTRVQAAGCNPVQMSFCGADARYHHMIINDQAPGLKESSDSDDYPTVLSLAVFQEFSRFLLEAQGRLTDITPADVPALLVRMTTELWELFSQTRRRRVTR